MASRIVVPWTPAQRSLLVGSILGDGWVSKPRNRAAHLGMQHAAKQLDYLLWKKATFETAGFTVSRLYDVGRQYPANLVHVGLGAKGVTLRAVWYPNGRKRLAVEELPALDVLGLTIWYLDDGSVTLKRKEGRIKGRETYLCTNGFDGAENEVLAAYLSERWGLEARVRGVRGYPTLKMNAETSRRLFALIEPHVPPAMHYKLDFQYHLESDLG